jgi:hypothetical protein
MVLTHTSGVAVLRAGCDCSIVEAIALLGGKMACARNRINRLVEQERPKLCLPERRLADPIPLVRIGAERC